MVIAAERQHTVWFSVVYAVLVCVLVCWAAVASRQGQIVTCGAARCWVLSSYSYAVVVVALREVYRQQRGQSI